MKKNAVGKPLDVLEPFIGEWSIGGKHAQVAGQVQGRSVFEWWEGRVFVIHRSTLDHADFPDSISIIGATRPDGGLAYHYYDTRGVHRVYEMTFEGKLWTLARKAVGPEDFSQRMEARLDADGNSISAEWQITEPGATQMKHDVALMYTRESPG
jgi:hypothetical protein